LCHKKEDGIVFKLGQLNTPRWQTECICLSGSIPVQFIPLGEGAGQTDE